MQIYYYCYYWAAVQANVLPLVESTYTLRRPRLAHCNCRCCYCYFVWLLVELRKPSSFLCVRGQFVNITFRYHIVNNGFGDSKIFNTNILVKLAIAYMMICVSSSRQHFGHRENSARPVVFLCRCRLQCQLKLALHYLNEAS